MSKLTQKQIRLAYIAAIYLTLAIDCFRFGFLQKETASGYLFSTSIAIFVTMACVADSAIMGRSIPFEVRLPFTVTWIASMPIYLLRSRGWWGALYLFVFLGSLIGVGIACAVIGFIARMTMTGMPWRIAGPG